MYHLLTPFFLYYVRYLQNQERLCWPVNIVPLTTFSYVYLQIFIRFEFMYQHSDLTWLNQLRRGRSLRAVQTDQCRAPGQKNNKNVWHLWAPGLLRSHCARCPGRSSLNWPPFFSVLCCLGNLSLTFLTSIRYVFQLWGFRSTSTAFTSGLSCDGVLHHCISIFNSFEC